MKRKIFVIAVLIFSIILYVYLQNKHKCREIKIREFSACVAISDTETQRELGLSGTQPLSDNEGMLFVFQNPDTYGFWMKDMNYPLDIIWIDKHKTIVKIFDEVSPNSYPKIFYPDDPSLYVLEVKSGTSKKFFLNKGDVVDFNL